MNDKTDFSRALLADVLAETEPVGQRDALLAATLGHVRRRRRVRRAMRLAGATAMAVALVVAAWRLIPGRATSGASAAGYQLVRTQPLPAEAVVTTRQLAAERRVTSERFAAVVRTAPEGGPVKLIDDRELLALAGPRPAVLVRVGPHAQELVFPGKNDPGVR